MDVKFSYVMVNLSYLVKKNCYGAETWALPGGHLEHGETLDECARRELKEELGIEVPTLLLKTIVNNIDELGI